MDEIKQVIIIRTDIDMGKGKSIAQGSHASLMSYFEVVKVDKDVAQEWIDRGEKKIVLKVPSDKELKRLAEGFKYKKIPHALVTDAGLTELPPGTVTALGAGPWNSKEIDALTSGLKLL
ncbi:MAG: peptidyl-tRNA hydrolase Pth2 [Candidatus Micrarchaeota archaeon]|nr:peptidyl-tRNA hydrolase Pth2 [Candidatus Micrarchaeota archaeon]MDE1823819.1 peptidyl-tRNA hydrolase Pth2 [Candidatus Micrarchaeota archaeon]MDE1849491.1 peptidyl-tRNA hydrolase Pth2 [Candidatus Micrarchaeota archaeon]